jgi:hypothetical protein
MILGCAAVVGALAFTFSPVAVAVAVPVSVRYLALIILVLSFWAVLTYYLTPMRLLELDGEIVLDLRRKVRVLPYEEIKRIVSLGPFGGILVVGPSNLPRGSSYFLTMRQVAVLRAYLPDIPN